MIKIPVITKKSANLKDNTTADLTENHSIIYIDNKNDIGMHTIYNECHNEIFDVLKKHFHFWNEYYIKHHLGQVHLNEKHYIVSGTNVSSACKVSSHCSTAVTKMLSQTEPLLFPSMQNRFNNEI